MEQSKSVFYDKIEDVLKTQGVYVGMTKGISMYPMLRNQRDTIVIEPCRERLKKYDVPLYRRDESYVLHRILEVLPDSYVIRGDNCMKKEYGIRDEDIVGVLTAFYRNGKEVDMTGFAYRAYVCIWCNTHGLRMLLKKVWGIVRSLYRKLRKRGASA